MGGWVDVLVIGSGPAGSTIARLLSRWGYAVRMLDGPKPRYAAAESLPPSVHEALEAVEISEEVAAAGFYPHSGTTSWWAGPEGAVENLPGRSSGFHVNREEFDKLLLDLAASAGVHIVRNTRAPVAQLSAGRVAHDGGITGAHFVVDATGRAGLLARQIRRFWDERYNTIALCGTFTRGAVEWDVDPHHTLVEAYESGWAWSAPLSPDRRHVCFMVDPSAARTGREAAFHEGLQETVQFRRLFEGCELEGPPWGRDASLYRAERYAGPRWMLVGDAGSFVDPLSSSGLEKALRSAWMGAAAINTSLSRTGMEDMALTFFNEQEEQIYSSHARLAASRYSEAAEVFGGPFWEQRAQWPESSLYHPAELTAAYQNLRHTPHLRFRLGQEPEEKIGLALRGREIVTAERFVLPGLEGIEEIHGIPAAEVAVMAPQASGPSDLYERYTARRGPVPLPDFLSVLALLVARGVLEVVT